MRFFAVVLVLLAASPSVSHAIPVFAVQTVVCSGSLTSDLAAVLSVNCSGDFSLTGGTLSADAKVQLTSGGSFTLDNLAITAPEIVLIAGGTLALGSGVALTASNGVTISAVGGSAGAIGSSAGGTLTTGGGSFNLIGPGSIVTPPDYSIRISDGATLTLAQSVPEPETYLTLLAGLLMLGGVRVATRARHGRRASISLS